MEIRIKDLMAEVYECEFEQFQNPPIHIFSLKHRKAMREMLLPYKETRKKITKRAFVVAIAIITTLLLSITAASIYYFGFKHETVDGRVSTTAFSTDTSRLNTIKDIYYLDVPAITESLLTKENLIVTLYTIDETNITLTQSLPFDYIQSADTKEEIIISFENNNETGYFFSIGSENILVWNNEKYVFELRGNCTKEDLFKYQKLTKIK